MTARFPLLQAATRSGSQRIAAAVAIVFASALSIPGAASAQTAATSAASAAAAASAPVGSASGGTQFTVQPGQSLNDAAVAMTQSRDRAVLARAAKAIFDANPNAFMGHDPSRLRLGAVLNLPAVDATGAASAATPASVAPGAAAASSNTSATTPASAPAATTTGASAAAGASSAAATTAEQSASAPAAAEATSAAAAGAQPTSSAAAPSAASGTHSYTGSIQGSESVATPPSVPATSSAQPASQQRPSSLQQLLALKNRVLMELQKHGIGKQPAANGNGTAAPGATQPSSATAGAAASAHPAPVTQPANQPGGIPQEYLGAAAIVGAGLVALLAGLTMRRRRKAARAQEAASDDVAREDETLVVAPAPVAAARHSEGPLAAQAPSEPDAHEAGRAEAIAATSAEAVPSAAEHDAEPKPEPETFDAASAEAALDVAATLGADALPRESLDPAREEARAAEAAELEQAAREREREQTPDELAAATPAAELPLDEAPIHAPVEPHFAEPIEAPHEASGEKPRPFVPDLSSTPGIDPHEPTLEQPVASVAPPIQLSHVEPAAQHEQPIEPLPETIGEGHAGDAEDETEQRASASLPLGAPPPLEPAVPDAFPRDALRALDSIDDFALPPRVEPSTTSASPVAPAVTQPVVAPEITAQQAVPSHAPQAPAAADEIIAGTAGAAAVAGLGAARFGALKLDFDLELPPSPSQVVPAFTPEEVARIARNKLDLAVEYIDLGDLVGARTLINEVIESNDADTRADARALLSTLAPLS